MCKVKIIPKGWGSELVFASNSDYCGKVLQFDRAGAKCSMHHHATKHESWYCLSGSFIINYMNPATAERLQESFKPGSVWHNAPGEDHQIECFEPGQILEVSTADSPDDNYRVEPGDSQDHEKVKIVEKIMASAEGGSYLVPPERGEGVRYGLTCHDCGHRWQALASWGSISAASAVVAGFGESSPVTGQRCPHCSAPVTTAMWERRSELL